jgi:cell wall-associated NlpC family hydrolase
MSHWSAPYVGTPWVAGTSDCWSFARRVWREQFGWQVPPWGGDPQELRHAVVALQAAAHHPDWQAVDLPAEGDAVLMGRSARPCHVGIWIAPAEGAGILHSLERAGVVYTPPGRLPALGLRVLGRYRRLA